MAPLKRVQLELGFNRETFQMPVYTICNSYAFLSQLAALNSPWLPFGLAWL